MSILHLSFFNRFRKKRNKRRLYRFPLQNALLHHRNLLFLKVFETIAKDYSIYDNAIFGLIPFLPSHYIVR